MMYKRSYYRLGKFHIFPSSSNEVDHGYVTTTQFILLIEFYALIVLKHIKHNININIHLQFYLYVRYMFINLAKQNKTFQK